MMKGDFHSLRNLVLGGALCFALPWYVLIVKPYLAARVVEPVAYSQEEDGRTGFYPEMQVHADGQAIYVSEGCAHCHTQMVRSAGVGIDIWRQGWGESQDARPEGPNRATRMEDFAGVDYAALGHQRNGPDLANVGYREKDRAWHHLHLFDPREVHVWSNMPSFRHLYKTQKISGMPSAKALPLKGRHAPEEGYEVVPSAKAEALVDYLYSLKRHVKLPVALEGGGAAANDKKGDEAS